MGAKFITWHDLLEGRYNQSHLKSFCSLTWMAAPGPCEGFGKDLRPGVFELPFMLHRRGHHWYTYELEDVGIDWIRKQKKWVGPWVITTILLVRLWVKIRMAADVSTLEKATGIFEQRRNRFAAVFQHSYFHPSRWQCIQSQRSPTVRFGITGVDRSCSPELWKSIRSMFSDGGFVSRPSTLQRKIQYLINSTVSSYSHLHPNLHFFRNHPFKFGNYTPPVDATPRFLKDFRKAGLELKHDRSPLTGSNGNWIRNPGGFAKGKHRVTGVGSDYSIYGCINQ